MATAVPRFSRIRCSERLSRYSSIRIGGPVESVVSVSTVSDLEKVLEMMEHGVLPAPLGFIGRGSNILFPDEGFVGTLVRFDQPDPSSGCCWEDNGQVRVSAGYPLPALAREAARRGFQGFEFLACIPGTVGGASVMNAGAGGQVWSDLCQSVTMMTRSGRLVIVPADRMRYRYRSSILSGRQGTRFDLSLPQGEKDEDLTCSVVLEVLLSGKPSDPGLCQELLARHLQYRKSTQPLDEPSLGSVFKNPSDAPDGYSAGRLIEESGLKGVTRGGVMVSLRHANFFVNTGKGRASEFMELLSVVMERVKIRWGIVLEPEVRVWNA